MPRSAAAQQAVAARVLTELLVDADRIDAPVVSWTITLNEVAGRTTNRAVFDAWVPLIDADPYRMDRRRWAVENWAADATVKVTLTYDPEG